jgi:hypothetical protein
MTTVLTNFQRVYLWLMLAFLSVLSISGTIALRNIIHGCLLLMLGWAFIFSRDRLVRSPLDVLKKVPRPLYAWIGFLILFPLWAVQPDVALFNLRGPWMAYILTWLLAYGAIAVLGSQGPGLWMLALASAAPVLLHLFLTLLAWAGLLTPTFYADPSFLTLWDSSREIVGGGMLPHWQAFPWGFHGVEPMHGNIGYASSQAVALSFVCLCIAWRARNAKGIALSALLIVLCFLSVIIAASRGAVYFGLLLLLIALLTYVRVEKQLGRKVGAPRSNVNTAKLIVVCLVALISIASFVYVKGRDDVRWYSMWDKVEIGWSTDNPLGVLCSGLSDSNLKKIKQKYQGKGQDYTHALITGVEGQDGGRILLMRAGAQLVLENPWGLDGSRQSYQKLMLEKCGHQPKLAFSHAHQAWINLALALGWLGASIFAVMMGYFVVLGWKNIGNPNQWPWAMALFLISTFWVLRGFTDAVYQDHYLQMQALLLAYLFARLWHDSERAKLSMEPVATKKEV